MLFVVLGYDGTDSEAPARRAAARAEHLQGAQALYDSGKFHYGGALLDADGNMTGSMMVLDYPSEEQLRAEFLSKEPYVTQGVWQTVHVHPMRLSAMLT